MKNNRKLRYKCIHFYPHVFPLKNEAQQCFGSIQTFLNTPLLKLHPPTSFKTFHLKLVLWRAQTIHCTQSHSIACSSGAICRPIFNLPATYSRVMTTSLKIAAGVRPTLSSGEWEEKWSDDEQQKRSCTGFERAIPRARVPAGLQRCVSTELEADLVRGHRWWMSWDGVWPNTAASIFTHRQTGRETVWHTKRADRQTDRQTDRLLIWLCFILIHFKLLWRRLPVACCSCITIYPLRWNTPLLFSENSYPVDVVVAIVVVVVAVNADIPPAQPFWSYCIKAALES